MSLAMTQEAREAFLAETRLGVLSVARGNGDAPLSTPVWYSYEPGGLVSFITGRATKKAPFLRSAGRVSMCVQSDAIPYSYVTIEGPVVSMDGPPDPDERRTLAHRYLGPELGDQYLASTAADAPNNLVVRIRPERWYTVDYGNEFR